MEYFVNIDEAWSKEDWPSTNSEAKIEEELSKLINKPNHRTDLFAFINCEFGETISFSGSKSFLFPNEILQGTLTIFLQFLH